MNVSRNVSHINRFWSFGFCFIDRLVSFDKFGWPRSRVTFDVFVEFSRFNNFRSRLDISHGSRALTIRRDQMGQGCVTLLLSGSTNDLSGPLKIKLPLGRCGEGKAKRLRFSGRTGSFEEATSTAEGRAWGSVGRNTVRRSSYQLR